MIVQKLSDGTYRVKTVKDGIADKLFAKAKGLGKKTVGISQYLKRSGLDQESRKMEMASHLLGTAQKYLDRGDLKTAYQAMQNFGQDLIRVSNYIYKGKKDIDTNPLQRLIKEVNALLGLISKAM